MNAHGRAPNHDRRALLGLHHLAVAFLLGHALGKAGLAAYGSPERFKPALRFAISTAAGEQEWRRLALLLLRLRTFALQHLRDEQACRGRQRNAMLLFLFRVS